MGTTSTAVVNQAIQLMGDNQAPVTGAAPNFDDSPAGVAASYLYPLAVNTVLRQFGWDFSRNFFTLAPSGNIAPPGWSFEYVYPPIAAEVWQLFRGAAEIDPNNPIPYNFSVGNTLVGGVQTKVIWAQFANMVAVLNNSPSEAVWDAGFIMAVARLLANGIAMAIGGKPDLARQMLETGSAFEQLAETRQD